MLGRLALAVVGLLGATGIARAAPVSADMLASFAVPHQRVALPDGRGLNLYCLGTGPRTVLFEAGGSDWSAIWALVQPRVAAHARACSYDRAGLGYSDPAKGPRSPVAIVEDLHALIAAAKLATPLILVGHSLGGFNAKLHAALYPREVAGLILVDPAEERSAERVHDWLVARYGAAFTARLELSDVDALKGLMSRYEACAGTAKVANLDPASIAYRRCSDPVRPALGPAIAVERQRLQVRRSYQEAQASEILNSVYGRTDGDAAYRALFRPGLFGTMPLTVLSHSRHDSDDPMDAADFASGPTLHRETAALSRAGRQRVVPDTSHNIEIDAPDAIVAAVVEMLGTLARPGRPAIAGR